MLLAAVRSQVLVTTKFQRSHEVLYRQTDITAIILAGNFPVSCLDDDHGRVLSFGAFIGNFN